jgi:hypothetical protein
MAMLADEFEENGTGEGRRGVASAIEVDGNRTCLLEQ